MTLHDIAYRNLTLYHFISHASISHPILLRRDSSYDVTHTLQYITSRCVALRVVAVHYITWCYVARNYATLLHRVASRSLTLHTLCVNCVAVLAAAHDLDVRPLSEVGFFGHVSTGRPPSTSGCVIVKASPREQGRHVGAGMNSAWAIRCELGAWMEKKHIVGKLHYVTSHYITSHYIASHRTTSHHVTLHHLTRHCVTSRYVALHYVTSPYAALHRVTSHYVALYRVTSRYTALHRVTSRYSTLHRATSRYVALQRVTSRYIALRRAMSYHIALHRTAYASHIHHINITHTSHIHHIYMKARGEA